MADDLGARVDLTDATAATDAGAWELPAAKKSVRGARVAIGDSLDGAANVSLPGADPNAAMRPGSTAKAYDSTRFDSTLKGASSAPPPHRPGARAEDGNLATGSRGLEDAANAAHTAGQADREWTTDTARGASATSIEGLLEASALKESEPGLPAAPKSTGIGSGSARAAPAGSRPRPEGTDAAAVTIPRASTDTKSATTVGSAAGTTAPAIAAISDPASSPLQQLHALAGSESAAQSKDARRATGSSALRTTGEARARASLASRLDQRSASSAGRIDVGRTGESSDAGTRSTRFEANALASARDNAVSPRSPTFAGTAHADSTDSATVGTADGAIPGNPLDALTGATTAASDISGLATGSAQGGMAIGMPTHTLVSATPGAPTLSSTPASSAFHLSSAPGDAAFGADLSSHISSLAIAGSREARIELSPQSLGPISIDISLGDAGLSIAIDASHPQTRAAIEQSIETLRASLADNGMRMANWSLGSGADQGSNGTTQGSGGMNLGDAGTGPGQGFANDAGGGASRNGAGATLAAFNDDASGSATHRASPARWSDTRAPGGDQRSARLDLYA